jgi:hypothetical protein
MFSFHYHLNKLTLVKGPWFKAHLQGKTYIDNTRRFELASSNIINAAQTVTIFHLLAANILAFTHSKMVF